jgi:vancomycin resistance protein YoaR
MYSSFPLERPVRSPLNRNVLDFAGLLLFLLVLTLLIGGALWHFWFVNRIYAGVSIAGLPVGGMTRATALRTLEERFADAKLAPVSLHHNGQHWPLPLNQVQIEADLRTAVNQAYLVGRSGDFSARTVQQVLTALQGRDITPPLVVDEAQLRAAIGALAPQVNRPGRPAGQVGDVAIPALPAVTVDVEATVQATLAALRTSRWNQTIQAPFVVTTETPVESDAPAPVAQTVMPTRPPLRVRAEGFNLEFALDGARLAQILTGENPPQVDEAALRTLLEGWAAQIDLAPRDARLRFNAATGGLTVIQTSAYGRSLNIEATAAAVRDALTSGATQASLVIEEIAPAVDHTRVAEMGIRELVASGTTYFKGSSAARIRNIEVAAEKFDGVVIPPNGIFSFNKIIENVTSANDFEDSLVIYGDQTVVGVGGGVCQVSTTVFRAAYAAGMPIVERYNHGYIVDWYGEPGLDATIFTPSVDFRFRNDTGAYLLIEPVVDSVNGVITFNLYGTKPDRIVTIGAPVQSDIKPADPPTYVVDESLAPGQRKQVEWEKPGMTVTVQRTIVENGTTRTDTLTSHYVPWRAQYLVGPGTDVPTTPAASDEATVTEDVIATEDVTETTEVTP